MQTIFDDFLKLPYFGEKDLVKWTSLWGGTDHFWCGTGHPRPALGNATATRKSFVEKEFPIQ